MVRWWCERKQISILFSKNVQYVYNGVQWSVNQLHSKDNLQQEKFAMQSAKVTPANNEGSLYTNNVR